jgi:hypothetical protein|nr:hypothetical protein [Alteromonas macleodii]
MKTLDLHPTNGCIMVKNVDSIREAKDKIYEALQSHPDIYVDWFEVKVCSDESLSE